MHQPLTVLVLALLLMTAAPAQAQLRADLPARTAPAAVYDQPAPGLSLGQLFNSETLRFGHSYEFSYGSFGGEGLGLGVYTTSMRWQPSERLAARVDVGIAHSPFGSSRLQSSMGFSEDQPARLFLRNASLAYRPTDNSVITLSIQQSPYGNYYQPFGHHYGLMPYGGHSMMNARVAPTDFDAMFFRDR